MLAPLNLCVYDCAYTKLPPISPADGNVILTPFAIRLGVVFAVMLVVMMMLLVVLVMLLVVLVTVLVVSGVPFIGLNSKISS
jgi:uncharacterized membrane protein